MATEGKPVKGILKHTSSLDKHDNPSAHAHDGKRSGMKWDEMNILATLHPADKDYGHMKIDEPPTPYSKYSDPEDEDPEGERRGSIGKSGSLDPSVIAAKLQESQESELAEQVSLEKEDSEDEDEDDLEYETPQDKDHRHAFELKRKIHYNEFQAVQLAKKLMAEEEDEEDDEEESKEPVAMDSNSDDTKQESSSAN